MNGLKCFKQGTLPPSATFPSSGHTLKSLNSLGAFVMDQSADSTITDSAPQSLSETRTVSLNSSNDHSQDFQAGGIYMPRPAYQRPVSYGQKSPSSCTHCGNLTPRYGSTTVYGTPLGTTPATSTEKINKYTYRHAKVS